MAKLVIKYKAIDPYYSDQTQTFIDSDLDRCWDRVADFEEWLGKDHPAGISLIYKTEILEETDGKY